ncbi:MAG: nucleoside triphosphate pyrophosphohydrolase [Rhodospirillaceae bacterium]|nr:nucleoside triphosphate pyrophosphohydrolase [Rhodospirillaceae bacterium]
MLPETRPIDRLLAIMARLRDPECGCPWDVEQTFETIAPYTIEEAYEVADAIQRGDSGELCDELGDLLLQVVFHARMAEEAGSFDFDAVAAGICDKMVRRHPHVFAAERVDTADEMNERWEAHKAAERHAKAAAGGVPPSVLDGVAVGLPALTRAVKLQRRAARIGFDWVDPADILDKLHEEAAEVAEAAAAGDPAHLEDELGDLLFVVANLCRRYEVDPEKALRGANAKFERRFRAIEDGLAAAGKPADGASLEEMEALWVAAKAAERA